MWQKYKGKWHVMVNLTTDIEDGHFLQTYCRDQIQTRKANQDTYPPFEKRCPICLGVWRIVCTSVDDARQTVAKETNVKVIECAAMFSKTTTLRKLVDARLKKLAKNKEHERKLRLIQKAFE